MLGVEWRAGERDGACVLVEAEADADMMKMIRLGDDWIYEL